MAAGWLFATISGGGGQCAAWSDLCGHYRVLVDRDGLPAFARPHCPLLTTVYLSFFLDNRHFFCLSPTFYHLTWYSCLAEMGLQPASRLSVLEGTGGSLFLSLPITAGDCCIPQLLLQPFPLLPCTCFVYLLSCLHLFLLFYMAFVQAGVPTATTCAAVTPACRAACLPTINDNRAIGDNLKCEGK